MNRIIKDKDGWIEIVEAFVAVLLVAGVLLIVLNKGYFQKSDVSERVYEAELSILREVQTNDSMRTEILIIPESSLPVEWTGFPVNIKNKIVARTPNYLECVGKICNMSLACSISENKEKDVYSQSVVISSTLQQGAVYRKLNLFCWTK